MQRVYPHIETCSFGLHCAMSAAAIAVVLLLVWLLA